jgi:hypothetical protein
MKSIILFVCCLVLFLSVAQGQQKRFVSREHGLSVSIPEEWDQVQGVLGTTVLKLARAGGAGQKARIVISLEAIPQGRVARDFDIWDMSNEEIRKAAEGTSLLGEKVTVIDAGRASIDGVHVIWNKARRPMPDKLELWEFVYEGIHKSRHITIRLTSIGNQAWFSTNQAIFADFIRSLSLKSET